MLLKAEAHGLPNFIKELVMELAKDIYNNGNSSATKPALARIDLDNVLSLQ